MNDSGTGAEFRVRSSWACLISTVLIYPALIALGGVIGWNAIVFAVMLGLGIGVQGVVMVVVHIYLAVRMPQEPDDERDRMVLMRAASVAGTVLQVGVFGVLALMMAVMIRKTVMSGEGIYATNGFDLMGMEMLPIYALLGVWIASELVRYALTITGYRNL